jgi:hypothetical protein
VRVGNLGFSSSKAKVRVRGARSRCPGRGLRGRVHRGGVDDRGGGSGRMGRRGGDAEHGCWETAVRLAAMVGQ